jgi:hypothetical protein
VDDQKIRVRFPVGQRFYSSPQRPAMELTYPPIQWVLEALSPGIKRQGFKASHLHLKNTRWYHNEEYRNMTYDYFIGLLNRCPFQHT